jgi:hypothetical protein
MSDANTPNQTATDGAGPPKADSDRERRSDQASDVTEAPNTPSQTATGGAGLPKADGDREGRSDQASDATNAPNTPSQPPADAASLPGAVSDQERVWEEFAKADSDREGRSDHWESERETRKKEQDQRRHQEALEAKELKPMLMEALRAEGIKGLCVVVQGYGDSRLWSLTQQRRRNRKRRRMRTRSGRWTSAASAATARRCTASSKSRSGTRPFSRRGWGSAGPPTARAPSSAGTDGCSRASSRRDDKDGPNVGCAESQFYDHREPL